MRGVDAVLTLKYAESVLPESSVFAGGDPEKNLPITFVVYLISVGDRKILVDAGCVTMPGFEMRNFTSPMEQLRLRGMEPEEITDVVITHSHHDHIEAVKFFPGAVVHIQEDEYTAGKRYIPDGMQVRTFREETLLADAVRVICIGGHSTGSCIVRFELDGCKYVICGDECYTAECLRKKIRTGASCCPEKSQAFVEEYGSGEYVTLLCHDPDIQG